eukprot:TRINITY_DN5602_c0_g1_i3.p1 TRINITY_DN5602_c0_g1~~TRINITY_DN5602_c0_g1_i3.p1  ORF type:complete len:414 (+),score=71.43 TRINITY_DN5602_c0_g1_i3:61-1302(+)
MTPCGLLVAERLLTWTAFITCLVPLFRFGAALWAMGDEVEFDYGEEDDFFEKLKACRPASQPPVRVSGDLNATFGAILTTESLKKFGPRVLSKDPWIVYLDNFLSEEEVDSVTEHMFSDETKFSRSRAGGENDPHMARNSETAFCTGSCDEAEVVANVREKATALTKVPANNIDFIQAVRYKEGMFYKPHHDNHQAFHLTPSGVRLFTMFVYLTDVEEGGGTAFPTAGVTAQPKKGAAVLFVNTKDEDPDVTDDRTLHEALPVVQGLKRGLNMWLYQNDFKTLWSKGCNDIVFADKLGKYKIRVDDGSWDVALANASLQQRSGLSVKFMNHGGNVLHIFWKGSDEMYMGKAPAGQAFGVNSHPGHEFIVRRGEAADSPVFRLFMVRAAKTQVVHLNRTLSEGSATANPPRLEF